MADNTSTHYSAREQAPAKPEKVSERLLRTGDKFLRNSKWMFWVGVSLIAFVAFLMLVVEWNYSFDTLQEFFGYYTFWAIVWYLGAISACTGIVLFFSGLHYMGLGQIAKNTDK